MSLRRMDKDERRKLLAQSALLTVLWQARNTKHKKQRLEQMLAERGITYPIEYRRGYKAGWYILIPDFPQRLGYEYFSAREIIQNGTLDFLVKP